MRNWFSRKRKEATPQGRPIPYSISVTDGNFISVVLKNSWCHNQESPIGIIENVSELLDQGERSFLFDFGNTTGPLYSDVIGQVLGSLNGVLARGGKAVVVLCDSLWEVFRETGLETTFPVAMEYQAALEWLVGPEEGTTKIVRSQKILPFSVHCREPSDSLFELGDGRFFLIHGGAVSPLMIGFDYILAEKSLAKFLHERSLNRVEILPVVILRRSTNEEIDSHCRIMVRETFSPEQVCDIPTGGERLAVMSGPNGLFVSPSLKTSLESAGFGYLKFSEGLRLVD